MRSDRFPLPAYLLMAAVTLSALLLCVCAGSVPIPPGDTLSAIARALGGQPAQGATDAIICSVRLPRVLCVALTGASLSLCGGAMQGLLRNPLADGSTLGVSSGASLGAVLAICVGFSLPGLPLAGTAAMAVLFAFLSMAAILTMAYRIDRALSTGTIILIGVIFSMFASSAMSLLIAMNSDKVKTITFWTMGSLAGSSYTDVLALLAALILCGGALMALGRELNAFSLGEENARALGVDIKRVKLTVMIASSALIGVCVSVGGTIGFVGLVTPHMVRMLVGPNHRKLLPASAFGGAVFLLLADLAARTLLSPTELPIGVVTSFVGAIVFVWIFDSTGRVK